MLRRIFIFLILSVAVEIYAQYREVILPESPKMTNYKDYETENSGFWCSLDIEGGSSVMSHSTNMQYSGFSWTAGYRFNEFLRLGAGLGFRYYVNNADVRESKNKYGFPVYANIRGNFISAYDRDGVPFWSFNVGGITDEGFFANPTIGYSFGGLRNSFQIGISYTITHFKNNEGSKRFYNYFGLKLGYEF